MRNERPARGTQTLRARGAGSEHFPSEDDADPEDSARLRRHPGALAEADADDPNRPRPVEDEAHARPHRPSSGTLASVGDTDELPVVESGLPVEPEDLGRQFLSTATQQNNFESELRLGATNLGAYAMGQMISEATLEASGQEGFEIPESSAWSGTLPDADLEPAASDFDLLHDAHHEASLFDRREEDAEMGDAREQARVDSDDTTPQMERTRDEKARELEAKQTREILNHGRGGRPRHES